MLRKLHTKNAPNCISENLNFKIFRGYSSGPYKLSLNRTNCWQLPLGLKLPYCLKQLWRSCLNLDKYNLKVFFSHTFVFLSHPTITPLYPNFLCLMTCPTLKATFGGLGDLGSGDIAKYPSGSLYLKTSSATHSPVSVILVLERGDDVNFMYFHNRLFQTSTLRMSLMRFCTPFTSLWNK